MSFLGFLKDVGITGLLDIALMSVIVYMLIVWFKKSKAFFVLIGIFIIGAVYLIAREMNLKLTAAVFQGFFAVILIAVIIIFQEEIKHLFERVAVWSLFRRMPRQKILHLARREIEILVRTCTNLAKERIGALIVVRGSDIIDRHLTGGVELNGEISEPLLQSLFDPHSMAHDGAVIVEGDRVTRFSCHLPLSKDLKKLHKAGTRHAAALGLTELTDALCLVVSEERGTISVALAGEIDVMPDPERLGIILQRYYDETAPAAPTNAWLDLFRKNIREKVIAVSVTALMWFFFVQESRLTYKRFMVPVQYVNLSQDLVVSRIRPESVEITLSGPRREFYFVNGQRLSVLLDMSDSEPGVETKAVGRSNATFPPKLSLETIQPNRVKFYIDEKNPPPAQP